MLGLSNPLNANNACETREGATIRIRVAFRCRSSTRGTKNKGEARFKAWRSGRSKYNTEDWIMSIGIVLRRR
jgi:hypothetical protein